MAESTSTESKCEGCTYTLTKFLILSADEEGLNDFIYRHGLLLRKKNCPLCQRPMKLQEDRHVFRCHNSTIVQKSHKKKIRKQCHKVISQYKNTFFQSHKLSTVTVCRLVAFWVLFRSPKNDFVQTELNVGVNTVIYWFRYIREVCAWYIQKESCIIGGTSKIVELQQAKIEKKWYNKGCIINGNWVFIGFEHDSEKCFLIPVADHSHKTVLSIIRNNILPGTIIVSEYWKAHDCLQMEEYKNLKDSYSYNFLHPEESAHTEHITRLWREVKGDEPRYGSKRPHLVGYLAEFLFKKKHKNHTARIHHIFNAIGELYDGENEIVQESNMDDKEDVNSDNDSDDYY